MHDEEELEDEKKCRGFAFLVLRDPELAQEVLRKWPWNAKDVTPPKGEVKKKRKKRTGVEVSEPVPSAEMLAAQKSGFRSLSM